MLFILISICKHFFVSHLYYLYLSVFYISIQIFTIFSLFILKKEDNMDMHEMQCCHGHVNLCGLTCFKKRPCAISCKQCLECGSGKVIGLSAMIL